MNLPDVVYLCKEGPNSELRYSLRTVATNLPHNEVHVFGGRPAWLSREVRYVKVRQHASDKYHNTLNSLIAAAKDPAVSEDFLVFNDDFFIVSPFKYQPFPMFHKGSLSTFYNAYVRKWSPRATYALAMKQTENILFDWGVDNPYSYELHVPMLINSTKLLKLVEDRLKHERRRYDGQIRTLYGNYYRVGGHYMDDVKITSYEQHFVGPFTSTDDDSFAKGIVGQQIRSRFNIPSIYEEV